MTNVDQFESVFKAASKPVHRYEPMRFERIAVVTDRPAPDAEQLCNRVRDFLGALGDGIDWRSVPGEDSETVEQLLGLVERDRPDLVVTYRNLHSAAWQWPHSLGRHLDVLTQATDRPVMVIPHPAQRDVFEAALTPPSAVMAVTDHLAGDGRLVNCAVAFTPSDGKLLLAHIEDDTTFERYMQVIGKIPTIDTDNARNAILNQLLKEPRDYMSSCRAALQAAGLAITVDEVVTTGHRISVYRELIGEHCVQLLVLHTKDEEQLAMHGLAYALAVELRDKPLLML